MRFVTDGPDLPNSLITQWRAGKVVFIAGAGVSVPHPSSLPTFRQLVLMVYETLHDPLFEALSGVLAAPIEERNQLLATKALSAQRKVETSLFFRGEFDRLFAALEARLDQNSNGLILSLTVRDSVESILPTYAG